MRKVKFLRAYTASNGTKYFKGQIINIKKDLANRLLIARVVAPII